MGQSVLSTPSTLLSAPQTGPCKDGRERGASHSQLRPGPCSGRASSTRLCTFHAGELLRQMTDHKE